MEKEKRIVLFRKLPVGRLLNGRKGRKLKKGMGILLAVALLFHMMPSGWLLAAALEGAGTSSFLAAEAVSYRDCDASGENWEEKSCETYTELTSDTTTWDGDWYVVMGNITISSRVTVKGEVHLILTDGCSLETQGITVESGNSLSIYAQSGGTGSLTATASGIAAGIGGSGRWKSCGTVTIYGGNVTATGGKAESSIEGGAGIGGGASGDGGIVIIHGGAVKGIGIADYVYGIGGRRGTVTITGGDVTAISDRDNGIGGVFNITGGTFNGKAYYMVTFVTDTTDVTIPVQGIAQEEPVACPSDPEGYVLSFFTDESHTVPYDFTMPVMGDTAIYVKCEVNNSYIVSVTMNGEEKLYTSPDGFLNAIGSTIGTVDVRLLQDVNLGSKELNVPESTTLTLDCGEWTLSGSGPRIVIVNGAFDFKGGMLLNTSRFGAAVEVNQNGKFTMSDGVVGLTESTQQYAVYIYQGAAVTITGGTIGGKGKGLALQYWESEASIEATIRGGTYSSIWANGNTIEGIIEKGYALLGTDGLVRRDNLTGNELSNVTITKCPHTGAVTDNSDGTHGGECPYCDTAVEREVHTLGTDNKCTGCGTDLVVQVEIGGRNTYYGAIETAWMAAEGNTATVTLLDDVTTSEMLYVNRNDNITFHGEAHTLSSTALIGAFFVEAGRLTIVNGTVTSNAVGVVVSTGELAVEGGTIQAPDASGYGIMVNSGTVHISGGSITGGRNAVYFNNDNGRVRELLLNYGNITEPHYAYYLGDIPVVEGLDQSVLPAGTYTVAKCKHSKDICEYQPVAETNTHSKSCLACGYIETLECTHDKMDGSNGDGTHTLSCTGCDSTQIKNCFGGTASYMKKAICEVCNGEYGEILKDTGVPTGEISINTRKWDSFLNTITFGLFFKNTEKVTLTANDQESGVESVSYYISEKGMSEEEVKALTTEWTDVSADAITFGISKDMSCVIYEKITDKQGNVTYISSDGIVFDGTLPSITGVENEQAYCMPQAVTVTDENLESVIVNGTKKTLPDGEKTLSFTLAAASGTQMIEAKDKAGNTTMVTVNMGHRYSTEWGTDAENHWHECSSCGDKSDLASHTKDNGTVTKCPTETEKGVKTYKCTVCGYVIQTEEIPMKEQDMPVFPDISKIEQGKNARSLNAELKVSQTGKQINVSWGKVTAADGYDVYVQYCENKFTKKSVTAIENSRITKATVKNVNGKVLNLKKNYKVYVLAYKMVNDKKVTLGKTITAHVVGRKNTKYTNAKAVKVRNSSYCLKKGKSVKVKASVVLVHPDKRQLSDAHEKEFRYATSNKKVATVSKKGKIRAVGKGNCIIYVYARNGYAKKVKVRVK